MFKRKDAYRDKSINGFNNILVDLKPKRSNSEVYINSKIDVTNFVKYIDELKKDSPVTYFHGMAMVIAKTIYSKPLLNRFVVNRNIYMHKNVSLAFVAKEEFTDGAMEILTIIKVNKDDTLLDISKLIKEKVNQIRNKKDIGGANNIVDKVGNLYKPIRVMIVGTLKFLDRKGLLPKSLTDENIYYSSAILSNLGTFKVGAIYHNLTDFGTSSSLITFGQIVDEGKRKYMEIGITIDERIADGFYFCKALKLIEYLFNNPKLLMDKASKKVDIKK